MDDRQTAMHETIPTDAREVYAAALAARRLALFCEARYLRDSEAFAAVYDLADALKALAAGDVQEGGFLIMRMALHSHAAKEAQGVLDTLGPETPVVIQESGPVANAVSIARRIAAALPCPPVPSKEAP
ncbi:hypothetical protein [Zavarzinia sp.]|jgi:hypothetical protein|uniref:hypothetical protein n=1 Tax=Zavarzinia sp. TaxID=2027920 RepID=UPI0035648974